MQIDQRAKIKKNAEIKLVTDLLAEYIKRCADVIKVAKEKGLFDVCH